VAGLLTEPPWLGQEIGHSERFPEELRRYKEKTMATSDEMPVWESVPCAYCQGTGRDRWELLSPLSLCSACGGRGSQLVQAPYRTCAHCAGDGAHPHLRVTCTTCHGLGVVYVAADAVPCGRCGGRGVDPQSEIDLACLLCGGSGWLAPTQELRPLENPTGS